MVVVIENVSALTSFRGKLIVSQILINESEYLILITSLLVNYLNLIDLVKKDTLLQATTSNQPSNLSSK